MSKLAEFRQLEKNLAEQLQALEVLKAMQASRRKLNLNLSCVTFSPGMGIV